MKIEFDTMTSDSTDARGLVALLVDLYGSAVLPADVVGQPVSAATIASLAPDGYPNEPQQDGPTEEPEVTDKISHVAPGQLDSAGIPWDERIHASTKTTNKDGTWTRRRNTPDETFDAVMAELRGNAPAATPTAPVVPVPPTASVPVAPSEPTAAEAFTPPASVTIPAAPPAPPAPAATGDAPSFVDLMKKITTLQGAGKLTKPDLDGYLQSCGVEGVGKLATASADARTNVGAILDSLNG